MRCISWNLNGLDADRLDERTEAAVFEMLLGGPIEQVLLTGAPPPPPDVLLLQEVVSRSWVAHLRPHLAAANYALFASEGPRAHFEVIAVQRRHVVRDLIDQPLPDSDFARRLLGVELENGLRVYTGHFDSMAGGSAARRVQLAHVLQILGDGPALFAGDTNLRDREVGELGAVVDAWEAAGDAAARVTWGRNMRFDRAYAAGIAVRSFRTRRATPLPSGALPSDHHRVEVVLDWTA